MLKNLIAICAFVTALCHSLSAAEELSIGSNAPKLELKKFIKGDEVKKFEQGKIYVVELWATWCGPCRATIPHLTDLQKKFEDVTIIGVAVLEPDQNAVSEFVEEMDKKMEYRVALDLVPDDGEPEDGKFIKNWMAPAGEEGIPTAFIINGEGKVAWIGHPGTMDEPLEQIVAGKWDLIEAAKKRAADKEAIAAEREIMKKMAMIVGRLQTLYAEFKNSDEGNPDELLKALESAATEIPDREGEFQTFRVQVLSESKNRVDEAVAAITKLQESELAQDPMFLNNIAWVLVKPERDTKADPKLLKLALKIAKKADSLTKNENPSVVDTLAKSYYDNGELAKAVETQERVVELAEGTRLAADPTLKKRLRQYKRALEATAKDKADGANNKSSKISP